MLATRTHFLQKLVDQLKTELAQVKKAKAAESKAASNSKSAVEEKNVFKRQCGDLQAAQAKLMMQIDEAATYTWKCLKYTRNEIQSNEQDKVTLEDISSLSLAKPLGSCTLGERERILTLLFQNLSDVDAGGVSMSYATNASRAKLKTSTLELPTIPGRRRSRSTGSVNCFSGANSTSRSRMRGSRTPSRSSRRRF